MELVGLSDQVIILEATGQEAPLRGPVGFVFNDDGKLHEHVSVQHALWEPYLMNGTILTYHDYWQDYQDEADKDGRVVGSPRVEDPKCHRTWMDDLINTPDYTAVYKPNFFTEYSKAELEELIDPRAWIFDIGVLKKVRKPKEDGRPKGSPNFVIEVTVKEGPTAY
jgi:hypothetical protein